MDGFCKSKDTILQACIKNMKYFFILAFTFNFLYIKYADLLYKITRAYTHIHTHTHTHTHTQ